MGFEAAYMPIIAAVAGSVVSSVLAPKQKDAPAPQTPTPAPAPQAAQAADSALFKASNAKAESSSGQASTLLTGLGGIANSDLSLGKNIALGA